MKKPAVQRFVPVLLRPNLEKIAMRMQINCGKEAKEYSECVRVRGLEVQERECQGKFEVFMACLKGK